MQKIVPHLWFDKEAKAAAEFYTSAFKNSAITHLGKLHDTPSGDCDIVSFHLAGYEFMAISAGPYFKINPSISFMLNFDPSKDAQAQAHLDELWNKLSPGGKVLMPLQAYPFSKRYGWIEDRFGVSWQLILTDPKGDERPFIIPALMFTGDVAGKAEAATDFYISTFPNSKRGVVARYPAGMAPDKEGTLMFTDFQIAGQWFAAMDSAHQHDFAFNEAVSLLVNCESQAEIDSYWAKMSADPESEQCGWIKDKFGVSWQINSARMQEMMRHATREQMDRLTKTFLPMKKFNLATLEKAYQGSFP